MYLLAPHETHDDLIPLSHVGYCFPAPRSLCDHSRGLKTRRVAAPTDYLKLEDDDDDAHVATRGCGGIMAPAAAAATISNDGGSRSRAASNPNDDLPSSSPPSFTIAAINEATSSAAVPLAAEVGSAGNRRGVIPRGDKGRGQLWLRRQQV